MKLPLVYRVGAKISAQNNLWKVKYKQETTKIRKLRGYRGIKIAEASACIDHIPLCIRIPLRYSAAQIIDCLKEKALRCCLSGSKI